MSRRELHILQVTAPGPVGGLESVVAALSLGLARRGHRVTLSAAVGGVTGSHPLLDLITAGGVGVVRAGGGYGAEATALRGLARELGADLVHSHGYRSDVLTRVAARGGRVPLVSTVHGFTGGGLKNRIYERIQVIALRGFEAVVPVSQPLALRLEHAGVAPGRMHLVPNVYAPLYAPEDRASARARLGLTAGSRVIGWVGRLSREKGPDIALRALARLKDRDWLVVFLGDGPERPALEKLAAEQGISSRVRWMGTLPGAGALMSGFDLLLMSSRTEGTPVVLLEAAAAGVPFVAAAVGGVPDLVGESGRAALVPPDDPAAMADRLARLLDHPDEAAALAAAQRERLIGPGRLDAWLDRYESIYQGILAEDRLP